MPHNIELIVALIAPLAALVLLRINAPMVFLSLCLGYVLVELVAKDARSLITFLAPQADSVSRSSWELAMLLSPAVLTSVIMVFSIKGRWKAALNILPAAACSVLALVLAVPLLTPALRSALQSNALWQQVSRGQAMAVGLGAFISLVFLWFQRRKAKEMEK